MSRRNSLFRSTGSGFRDAEGVEIATEMTPGEPLRFSAELITEHSIMSEYAMICRDPIDGLYAVPSARNKFEWFGLLFIRRGVYAGAVFRFTLHLPVDFPSTELPRVVFGLDVFHPHVNPATRELDLKRYFVDGWKSDQHHIYHILLIVQRTFFTFDSNPATCVNTEAATLLRDNRELFRIRAGELIRESRSVIYDPVVEDDVNAIRLMPWDASIHEPLRQRLIGGLTDSQISTMSMLGSLGCGLNRSSVFDCRGKYGFSWISPTDLCYMVEPPRPVELDLKTISEAGKCSKNAGSSHGSCAGKFSDQSVSDNVISQIYELNLNDGRGCVQENEKELQGSEKNDLLKSTQQNKGAVEDFGTKNNRRISGLVEKAQDEWENEGQGTDMNAFSKPENSAHSGSEYVKAYQDGNVPSVFQPRSSWNSDEIGESDI